jgi:AhpC/TSA family protein
VASVGRSARAARAARSQRRRRTLIATAATALVVAVFAMIVLAVRDDASAGRTSSGAVGSVFPEFTLTGADGTPITRATLAGKKALIWFTDSSCPDPDGLARTAELDDELGGQTFTVLGVLVNLREPSPAEREWRDAFGRPDWLVGPDERGELSSKVGLRTVETKYLLDEHGTVLNVTTSLVTDGYLTTLREQVRT